MPGDELIGGDRDFSVIRLGADGALDGSFGSNGRYCHDLGGNSNNVVFHSSLQSDGKIVVTGLRNNDMATVRYSTSGALDGGFDSIGLSGIVVPLLTTAEGRGVSIGSDGGIAVVGSGTVLLGGQRSLVLKLSANGVIDATFGLLGFSVHNLSSGNESLNTVAHDSNSKLIAGGEIHVSSKPNALVARLTTGGTLDSAFGGLGNGTFTHDFSGGGRPSEVLSLALLSNDKVVAAGYSHNGSNEDMLIFRLNSNGTLDTTFGSSGIVKVNINGTNDRAQSVILDSSGRILVAGHYVNGTRKEIALLRLTASGALDAGFGSNGVVTTGVPGYDLAGQSVRLQSDGKIIVGATRAGTNSNDGLVLRYRP